MGKHSRPSRKAVHFARIAVGGIALAEITGGFAAIPAEAATPPHVYTAQPVLAAHVEHLHKKPHHGDHKGHHHGAKHHAVKPAVKAPAAVAPAPAAPVVAPVALVTPDPDMGMLIDHYTVIPGDTLTHIAAAYGLPWEAMWSANSDVLEHPDQLIPGQVLRLPA
jgi:LysM domain